MSKLENKSYQVVQLCKLKNLKLKSDIRNKMKLAAEMQEIAFAVLLLNITLGELVRFR